MPPSYTPQQYLDRIIPRVRNDGAIIVEVLGSGRAYDGNDQAFIVCAVSVLGLSRNRGLGDAYWRYEGESGQRRHVVTSILVAIAAYVQNQALDPEQDEHWNNVRAIAHGVFMKRLVMDNLEGRRPRVGTPLESFATNTNIQYGQPNSAIRAAFTERTGPNADIVVEAVWYRLEFDFHTQAFILCAVTNMLLGPQSLNDAYWSYKKGNRNFYLASTLRAIATYIHIRRSSYQSDMLDVRHWDAVLDMANGPHMQAVVGSHLLRWRRGTNTLEVVRN